MLDEFRSDIRFVVEKALVIVRVRALRARGDALSIARSFDDVDALIVALDARHEAEKVRGTRERARVMCARSGVMFDENRYGIGGEVAGMADVMTHVGRDEWRAVDRALRSCARRRSALDAEEARWLALAERMQIHRRLGCASIHEYVERVLGWGPRASRDRLRVARALAELPRMTAALASAELSHSAVRELVRVATPATEAAWIDLARGCSLREIEEAVSGREPGDLPDDPGDADPRPMTIELELSPSTMALYREALRALEREVGEPLTDDQAVARMCQVVLAGDRPDDRDDDGEGAPRQPPHQIAVTVCERCKRGWHDAAGRAFPLSAAQTDAACCDADVIGRVDGDGPAHVTKTIPPAIRRQVLRRDRGRCVVPGCRSTRFLEVHHVVARADGGDHDPRRLCLLCSGHHQALHAGLITISGEAPDFEIRRRDAPPVAPTDVEGPTWVTAIAALQQMGFKRGEAIAAVRDAERGGPTTLQALIVAALRRLRPPS